MSEQMDAMLAVAGWVVQLKDVLFSGSFSRSTFVPETLIFERDDSHPEDIE